MLNEINKLRQLYEQGTNIIDWLKKKSDSENLKEFIEISYDLQAGNYIKKAKQNPEYEKERADVYSRILNGLGQYSSVLEIGIGEGTSFCQILPLLANEISISGGFDISYSRIMFGSKHIHDEGINNSNLFVGDLFNTPIEDNAIDVVYTNHTLEPNGGREKEALIELYRITKDYLVLFEPSFEFANRSTKEYIEKHGYIKGLSKEAVDLGYQVIENRLLFDSNPLSSNNTSVIIIDKKRDNREADQSVTRNHLPFACPVTKKPLELLRNNYYCPESHLLYPVVDKIPCLRPENAIIASHYLDPIY